MNQWKAIAAILLIFSSGAGTGYLLKSRSASAVGPDPGASEKTSLKSKNARQHSVGPVFFRSLGFLNDHLKNNDLKLTAVQLKKLGEIMDASRARITEKGADFREVLAGEHETWRADVRRELTPKQQKVFDNISNFRFRKEPGKPDGSQNRHPKSPESKLGKGDGSV